MSTIGVLVLVKDPRSVVNRYFSLFALSNILWMVFLYFAALHIPDDMGVALMYVRLTFGASVFLPFFLSQFFYNFPSRTFKLPMWATYLFYVLTFGLVFLCVFTPLVEESMVMVHGEPVDVFGPLYSVYMVHVLFHFFFSLVVAIKKLRTSKGVERSKLAYVSVGFFVFFFLAMMTNVVLPIFGIIILQREAVAFTLVLFFSVAYSVYRHRFFNLNYLFLFMLREITVFVILLGVFWAVYLVMNSFITDRNITGVISLLFSYLFYRLIDSKFPYFYSSSFKALMKNIHDLTGGLFQCKSFRALDDLLGAIFVERLNFRRASIYMVTQNKIHDGVPIYVEDELTKKIQITKDALSVDELYSLKAQGDTQAAILLQKMIELKACLCFPLFFQKTFIGIFVLGSRLGKSTISSEEFIEIRRVMDDIGLAFMNIIVNENLREENDVMKQIINQKTQILRKNNTKLHEMIKQQDSFISLTAHEFRTPLTVAMLGMEQIPKIHKGQIPNEVVEDVQTSYRQLDRLTTLINRLLEMRRLEDNKIPVVREKFELIGFAKMLVGNMQLLASKDNVLISLNTGKLKKIMVNTDQMKIQEVLENLMQNALKFSKNGDVIQVTIGMEKKGDAVSISVADQGPGVPRKDQKIIFEKFRQGSRYSRGIGVGLYLCKQYLKLLKGSISLKSVEGKGATFTVTFPVK
jgi:signal transduction histidine kinase